MSDEGSDVVIAGGGPAGPAIAGDCATRARVLSIERRRDGLDVVTSRGSFPARLAVGAMGCTSSNVDQHQIAERIKARVLHGAGIRLPEHGRRPRRFGYYLPHDSENTHIGIHPFGHSVALSATPP